MNNERVFERKVGAGVLRVTDGLDEYGGIMIDLVVERNGRKYELPIVTIENPVDPSVESAATKADATSVYVYGDLNEDAYTHKVVIPNRLIDEAVSEMAGE